MRITEFRICMAAAGVVILALSGCGEGEPPVSMPDDNAVTVAIPQDVRDELARLGAIADDAGGPVAWYTADLDAGIVELPAGSVNGLAGALAQAGNNGVVIVRAGMHTESGTVVVSQRGVKILGEPGAVLRVNTVPFPVGPTLNPALHIRNASNVTVWGLDIQPTAAEGGVGVLVEASTGALIAANTFEGEDIGIMLQNGNRTTVWRNAITIPRNDQDLYYGIVVINGDNVLVAQNTVRSGIFGIWACDRNGVLIDNDIQLSFVGVVLCKVPMELPMPDGTIVGSDESGNHWLTTGNNSSHNAWGYLVIDGANNNTIINNAASENSVYDVELTADTFRFGFLTPAAFDNRFVAGRFRSIQVKNCGNNNTIVGGVLVNTTEDPCF